MAKDNIIEMVISYGRMNRMGFRDHAYIIWRNNKLREKIYWKRRSNKQKP